jgi:Pyridoxamine 5'-phosphate oxidase
MYWPQFAAAEPELAARGWELLAEQHGYVFLATVRADGSPRLHPIVPILGDRGPVVAVKQGSPKLADIRREPRIALHSTVLPPADEEFSIRGILREVIGPDARQAAVAGSDTAVPPDVMVLFELDLVDVGWATWPEQGRPLRERWRAP